MSRREITSLVYHRDGHHCRYCGVHLRRCEATVDHYLPQALGGTWEQDNLRLSCRPCNEEKADSHPDDWEATLRIRRAAAAQVARPLSRIELLARCAPLWRERPS